MDTSTVIPAADWDTLARLVAARCHKQGRHELPMFASQELAALKTGGRHAR